jgi:hypothetical protein
VLLPRRASGRAPFVCYSWHVSPINAILAVGIDIGKNTFQLVDLASGESPTIRFPSPESNQAISRCLTVPYVGFLTTRSPRRNRSSDLRYHDRLREGDGFWAAMRQRFSRVLGVA